MTHSRQPVALIHIHQVQSRPLARFSRGRSTVDLECRIQKEQRGSNRARSTCTCGLCSSLVPLVPSFHASTLEFGDSKPHIQHFNHLYCCSSRLGTVKLKKNCAPSMKNSVNAVFDAFGEPTTHKMKLSVIVGTFKQISSSKRARRVIKYCTNVVIALTTQDF